MSRGQEYAGYAVRVNGKQRGKLITDESTAIARGRRLAVSGVTVTVVGINPSGTDGKAIAEWESGWRA